MSIGNRSLYRGKCRPMKDTGSSSLSASPAGTRHERTTQGQPTLRCPEFLYFDLGQVLVCFDHGRLVRQLAAAAGAPEALVRQVLFDEGMQERLELGRMTTAQFYAEFCNRTGTRAAEAELRRAATEFFWPNHEILPLLVQLRQRRYRMGILSNTCELHWEYCCRRFAYVAELFDCAVLSFRVGGMKPDRKIFEAAAEAAGCAPEELFFTDDIAANQLGAAAAGIDAVVYRGAGELIGQLRRRGLMVG